MCSGSIVVGDGSSRECLVVYSVDMVVLWVMRQDSHCWQIQASWTVSEVNYSAVICVHTCTVLSLLSAQGTYVSHFRWALIEMLKNSAKDRYLL